MIHDGRHKKLTGNREADGYGSSQVCDQITGEAEHEHGTDTAEIVIKGEPF